MDIKKTMQLNDSVSTDEISKQESLTQEILEIVNASYKPYDVRPTDSFRQLLEWTTTNFSPFVYKDDSQKDAIIPIINNRIVIDGQFLTYCKENSVTVKCLYHDAIVSWATENNYEKFLMQGVFLISIKDCSFVHAALFHKGANYSDEVSFFTLVKKDDVEKYISFRNEFDKWVTKRDRSTNFIHIADGEDVPFERDSLWEDLFLPENMKNDIKNSIEVFLSSKDLYARNKIPWKKGLLLWGPPGCGKTSIIRTIISNYDVKPVTINPGSDADALRSAFMYAEEQSPAVLYLEDLDSMLEGSIDLSSFLNLMDGVVSKNGLLIIATANDIKKMKKSVVDRPSRFDRKFKIDLPDVDMSKKYLSHWFNNKLTDKQIDELAKSAVKSKMSYAYLKDIYISSMFEAVGDGRENLTNDDVQSAMKKLMDDKKSTSGGNAINIDKYTE